ncbi:MAG: large conductance mechanosensitive channel protein MscL [Endomicrobium sp.]|jgi:large conductance mechanosensitive channel|nr:large conductance mechanosensitive channel protein MscL [Endomicrobium sp.]
MSKIKAMISSFLKDFENFAVKGNAIDMAVGIIIGAAFGKIVDSLVKDIIMPPIGLLLGNFDFTNLFVVLKSGKTLKDPYETLAAAQSAGAITINIGLFLNVLISFIIIAFCVFIMIKCISKLKEKSAPSDQVNTKECHFCCSSIPLRAVKCPDCTADLNTQK